MVKVVTEWLTYVKLYKSIKDFINKFGLVINHTFK